MALSAARLRHEESADCWCEPVLDHISKTGVRLYIHREFDGDDRIPPTLLITSLRVVTGAMHDRRELHLARLGCQQPGAQEHDDE